MTITANRVTVTIEIEGMDLDCPLCGEVVESGSSHTCVIPEKVIQVEHCQNEELLPGEMVQ